MVRGHRNATGVRDAASTPVPSPSTDAGGSCPGIQGSLGGDHRRHGGARCPRNSPDGVDATSTSPGRGPEWDERQLQDLRGPTQGVTTIWLKAGK